MYKATEPSFSFFYVCFVWMSAIGFWCITVSSVPGQEIGWEERPWKDLFTPPFLK